MKKFRIFFFMYAQVTRSTINLIKEDILLKVFSTAQVRKIREIRNGASEE